MAEGIPGNSSITMWGPTGSGKTWLLQAFAKELEWYNEKDDDFHYLLSDFEGQIILSPRPLNSIEVDASSQSVDILWNFERIGKKPKKREHQVSSHIHRIIVHDNPGVWLTDAVEPQKEFTNAVVLSTLLSSTNVIIMLDPTSVQGSPILPTSDNNKVNIPQDQYEQWLSVLLSKILQKHKEVNAAVCLCKSDRIPFYLPTEEIIRVVFGDGTIRVFNKPGINKNFFRVSSVGHLRTKEGNSIANIDVKPDIGETIKDGNRWKPINVVSPFFWLFEKIERKRIMQQDIFGDREKIYIPYPPPRKG